MAFIKTVCAALCLSVLVSSGQKSMSSVNNDPDTPGETGTMLDGEPALHTARVQILAVNDFHGQISAGKKVAGRIAGSAPVLMAYLRQEEAAFDGTTIFAHTGDFVGASAPLSALMQDEPSIMMFNALVNKEPVREQPLSSEIRNVIGIPGNHEFDEGVAEFLRMIRGGEHPKGPFLEEPWDGAKFPYICANFIDSSDMQPVLPPYVIKRVKDTRIAFIGATLEATPTIVPPGSCNGYGFTDEVASINAAVAKLRQMKIRAIIVLVHQGGQQEFYSGPTDPQKTSVSGAISEMVSRLDGEIDIVLTGHTHCFTNGLLPSADSTRILVVQGLPAGTAYSDIEFEVDRNTDEIITKKARVVTAWADSAFPLLPDPDAAAIVNSATSRVAPKLDEYISEAQDDVLVWQNSSGESALGNLVADAQREALKTDFAMVNPGGIRADIRKGVVTWGDCFSVLPFGNRLATVRLTGQQVMDLLNEQWRSSSKPHLLQISGFSYTWIMNSSDRGTVDEITLNGRPFYRDSIYSIALNSYLAAGGDGFTLLTEGAPAVSEFTDIDALTEFLKKKKKPFCAKIENRIMRSKEKPVQEQSTAY